ncbi:MAG: RecQ family ATP-dependent DNA helicase, partial [Spirochaetales bacterium]|nr:RecQ family ATP-dependent DNA helicase [Spirochaetales bacterium]
MNTNQIAFLDIEGYPDSQEHRFGILYNTLSYTTTSASEVKTILEDQPPRFICGHNFVEHDYEITKKYSLNQCINRTRIIDTLALSMLLHPGKKSHKLDKPYRSEIQLENFPAADCEQTRQLLLILKDDYLSLSSDLRDSLHLLLKEHPLYQSFFEAINYLPHKQISTLELLSKKSHLEREILNNLIHEYPVECGILCTQLYSENKNNFSRIIIERYPELPRLKAQILFDVSKTSELVQKYAETEFGFGTFREFPTLQNGLFTLSQKTIIESAVQGKSFLCVLPTGGGKTFTFQLPAIIKADFCKTLTVVISPLQALMKNHTDNFNNQIQNFKSAALSGFLDPISRINTLEEIHNGTIDILYLAPEALRSNVVFKALQSRVIERFVIDEAHCFSAWGHDFRHDYFYIRECLAELQKSDYQPPIPVSCFTATARPNVLKDISNYFQDVLSEQLEEYIASSERTNLNYSAIAVDNQAEKYNRLIDLITLYKEKAIIIYRPQNARGCKELAKKLQLDERINHFNLVIEPFYSKMDEDDDRPLEERRKNQVLDDFIINNVNIVIATTAFGMGIDKPDIEAVIHYDPSDSLESYMQESGRGARSSHIQAECVVLYTEKDFARIFQTQNRSKLQYDEIDRVARFCKKNNRRKFQSSTRTIAQGIGIDTEDTAQDFDTLIKTAILELEKWKIIKRGRNRTKIFATSILLPAKEDNRLPMEIVHEKLDPHREEYGTHYPMMIELMNNIIQKSKTDPVEIEALADIIGISKKDIFEIVLKLQEAELLDFYNDISVLIDDNITTNLQKHFELEDKILQVIKEEQNNHKIDLRLFHDDSYGDDWLNRVSRIIKIWLAIGPIVQDNFKIRIN